MKFLYTAKTQQGELQSGVMEAGSRETAIATLQGYGLVVLRLEEEAEATWYTRLLSSFRKVSVRDLSVFTRQFATLLEAQVPLTDSLRTLFSQTTNVFLKEAVFDVISDVEGGAALSQAFSQHPRIFSQFYVQMVRSAEITGRLQEVFSYLADYLESQARLNARVRSAMLYPVFIFGLFAVVAGVMVGFVLPQLAQVFRDAGVDFATLPPVTRFLFGLGNFAPTYGPVTLVVLIMSYFAIKVYFSTPEGQDVLAIFLFRIPLVGSLSRQIYLARFAETTSVMISGDIPIAQAIEIAAQVVGNSRYRQILDSAAEGVRRGELISESLNRYPDDFPPLVTQMIAIGEKTGRIDDLLRRASKFYGQEIERAMSNVTELLQPILIVILGVFVGLLISAVILPIYQLAQTF